MSSVTLRVGRTMDRCSVLGPGVRAVVWVAGCPLRCRECIAPEFLDTGAGREVAVTSLANWIAGLADIDGVTLSGGEPFQQAGPLCVLLDEVRAARPQLTAVAFTGYTLDRLHRRGSREQRELLRRLDILVDGPYVPERHSSMRWRGSANQRLHALTDRHALADLDDSAGVEVHVEADGGFTLAGVPPTRGFRAAFEARLGEHGVLAATEEETT